jgi:hypothetical protein
VVKVKKKNYNAIEKKLSKQTMSHVQAQNSVKEFFFSFLIKNLFFYKGLLIVYRNRNIE